MSALYPSAKKCSDHGRVLTAHLLHAPAVPNIMSHQAQQAGSTGVMYSKLLPYDRNSLSKSTDFNVKFKAWMVSKDGVSKHQPYLFNH